VRPDDLMRNEEAGWTELNGLLHGLTAEQLTAPGYTDEGWSIKDMMWHIAAWSADAASHFERMRAGTFDPGEVRYTRSERGVVRGLEGTRPADREGRMVCGPNDDGGALR